MRAIGKALAPRYDGDDICAPYRGTRGLHEQHYLLNLVPFLDAMSKIEHKRSGYD